MVDDHEKISKEGLNNNKNFYYGRPCPLSVTSLNNNNL